MRQRLNHSLKNNCCVFSFICSLILLISLGFALFFVVLAARLFLSVCEPACVSLERRTEPSEPVADINDGRPLIRKLPMLNQLLFCILAMIPAPLSLHSPLPPPPLKSPRLSPNAGGMRAVGRYGGGRCCHHGPPVTVGGDNDSSQRSSISRLNLLFMAPHPAPCAPGWTASFHVADWSGGVRGGMACQSCRFAAATTTTTESNHQASCRKRTSVHLLRPTRWRFSPPATW